MAPERRLPLLLALVTALLAATAATHGPAGALDVAVSGEGQTPEPPGPARLEASGESDLSTSAQLGKAVTSLAMPGSPLAPEPRDPPPGGDPPPRERLRERPPPPGGAERAVTSPLPMDSPAEPSGTFPACPPRFPPACPRCPRAGSRGWPDPPGVPSPPHVPSPATIKSLQRQRQRWGRDPAPRVPIPPEGPGRVLIPPEGPNPT
ncbi:proline-rich protein HaeIII subfamily 1-like [Passer domesticus]|uniref:proline-rich protein HaeIII subfamily 1-like n=1 Tax=Passer domesticus TaxID=48849 RepID=UPI0030FE2402